MNIQRVGDELVIKIPANIDADGLQRLINFLVYREATSKSKATQEEVNDLAKQINKGWWERNKHKFTDS